MRVGLEVELAPPPVGDVGVELGRAQVGVAEHLLDAAQVGAALEQVGRERVAQQVGVDAARLEPGDRGQPAQDQEGARAGQRPALRVQEELGAVAAVEVGAAAREVAAQRLDRWPPDRDDALLAALADDAHEPVVEVDAALLEPDRLGDAQPRAVEQLDERAVAQRSRRRAVRGPDQPLGLAGRERPRQRPRPPRQRRSPRRGCRLREPSSCRWR